MTIVPNQTVLIQIGLFLFLMIALNALLFKPMLRLLEERKARTQGRREKAVEAEANAEGIWKDYQSKIADARAEAELVRKELVRQGEVERQKVTDAASAEADKTSTEIRARISADAAKAREDVRTQVEVLAKTMAEKLIGRAV